MENEFVILYEQGPWYVIENKLVKDLPIVHRGETKTLVHMIHEFGMFPDGSTTVVRSYYPKSEVELRIVVNTFHHWTNYWKKKLMEYEKMRGVLDKMTGGGALG